MPSRLLRRAEPEQVSKAQQGIVGAHTRILLQSSFDHSRPFSTSTSFKVAIRLMETRGPETASSRDAVLREVGVGLGGSGALLGSKTAACAPRMYSLTETGCFAKETQGVKATFASK